MDSDIRFRNDIQVDEFLAQNKNFRGVVSLGDEGCPHKIPPPERLTELAHRLNEAGLGIKLVTPRVAESHLDSLLDKIKLLDRTGLDFTLTVNDVGFLVAAHEVGCLPRSVLLGTSLARSMQECPWIDDIVSPERTGDLRRLLLQNTMWDEEKFEFFSQLGVTGVEVNWPSRDHSSLALIRQRGWRVSIHWEVTSLAFTRSCPVARLHSTQVPLCVRHCDEALTLEMARVWDLTRYEEANAHLRELADFRLVGNVLYDARMTGAAEVIKQVSDEVVFHRWRYDDLQDLMKKVRVVTE